MEEKEEEASPETSPGKENRMNEAREAKAAAGAAAAKKRGATGARMESRPKRKRIQVRLGGR